MIASISFFCVRAHLGAGRRGREDDDRQRGGRDAEEG